MIMIMVVVMMMIMLGKIILNNLNTFQVTSADEFVWIDSHNRLVEVIILFLPISTVNINVNCHDHDPPSGPTAPVEQRRSSESGSARRSEGVGQQGWFQELMLMKVEMTMTMINIVKQ